MTPLPPLAADAGISLILAVPRISGRERVLAVWADQLEKLRRPFEILSVDSDRLSEAVRTPATQPIVVLVTGDHAYRPGDIRPLIESLNQVDLALGVRPGKSRTPIHARWTRLLGWVSRVVFGIDLGEPPAWYGWQAWRTKLRRRVRYGMRVQDAETGLRAWRRDSLESIAWQSDGRFVLVEMIAKVSFTNGLIAEVPLSKPADLPVAPPFAEFPEDEARVRRRPEFVRPRPTINEKDPGEMNSPGPASQTS